MQRRIQLLLTFLSITMAFNSYASDEKTMDELQQRIQELEEAYFDLEERVGRTGLVKPALSPKFTLGGFYNGVYQFYESNNSSTSGLDINAIYLAGEGNLSDRWAVKFAYLFGDYVSQKTYLNSTGGVDLNNLSSTSVRTNTVLYANASYQKSDSLRLSFGRQRSQVGIIPRELYPLSYVYSAVPEYASQDSGTGSIVPLFIDGLSASGKFFLDAPSIISYSVTAGTVSNMEPTASVTNGDATAFNSEAYIGRVAYGLASQSFEIGLSYVNAERNTRVIDIPAFILPPNGLNISIGGERFSAAGVDVYVNTDVFQLKAEYFTTSEKTYKDRSAYYIQPVWLVNNKWELFYRNEMTDIPPVEQYAAPAVAPVLSNFGITPFTYPFIGKTVVNAIGFRFKAMDNVHLKFGLGQRTFKDIPQNEKDLDFSYLSVVAGF